MKEPLSKLEELATWDEYVKLNDYDHDGTLVIDLPIALKLSEEILVNSLVFRKIDGDVRPCWSFYDRKTGEITYLDIE